MAAPAVRYVDPANVSGTASDANDGTTLALAWLTIGKAIDSAPAGSIVYCRAYVMPTLTISNKGSSRKNKAKTVIAPYGRERWEMATPSNVTLTNCHKVTITGVIKTPGAVKGGGFTIEDCTDVGIVGCGRLDGSVEGLRGVGLTAGSNPAARNQRIQICGNFLKQVEDAGFLINMSASGEPNSSTPFQRIMIKRNRMREGQVAVRAGFFNFCWIEDNDLANVYQLNPENHADVIRSHSTSGEFAGSNWYVRRNLTTECDTLAFFIKDGIIYNLVYENNITDQGAGNGLGDCSIYNVQGARIVNNTLTGSFTWSLQGANPAGVTLFNNIANDHNKDPDTTVGFVYKGYNSFTDATPGVTDDEGAETGAPPIFVDQTNKNYELDTGSPGLNTGRLTDAPTTDQRGRPRPFGASIDRGALERQTV